MKRNKRLGNQGFTLIEVLLSIAILALITVPLMKYFSEAAKYSSITAKKQKATLTAQETIEAIKGQTVLVKWQGANDATGLKKMHFDLVEDLKKRFRVPEDATFDEIEAMQNTDADNPQFNFSEGKGKLIYAYEDTSKWSSGLGVRVMLKTDLGNEEVSSPLVYGIDDTKNIIAAEHTEEDDAIVFFQNANAAVWLQKSGSYIIGVTPAPTSDLETYTAPPAEGEGGEEGEGEATPASTPRVFTEDMRLFTEEDIRTNMQRVAHAKIEDNPDLGDNYYKVAVYYEYICNNIYGTGTSESYITPALINTNLLDLEGLYFMYNRVGVTEDKFVIEWDAREPDDFPEFRMVCQNLDVAVEGYDPANYRVSVEMTTKTTWTTGYTPSFRSNLTSENPISVIYNTAVLDGAAINVNPLTTSTNPVRVFDVWVGVYGSKAEMLADTSDTWNGAMILMKTTKIE